MLRTNILRTLAIALVASFFLADYASAATLRYRASGDWTQITDGSSPGWGPNPTGVGSSLPGASDDARINFGNNTVTVTTAVPAADRVQIGVDESGTLVVANGGVLTAVRDVLAGNNNMNATGTLIVENGGTVDVGRILWSANNDSDGDIDIQSGGVVNVASHLWLGVTGTATIDISGTLNQTGGNLGLGTSNASTPSGGTATLNILDGGLLALNNIDGSGNSVQPGSIIDISGTGQLTLPGDFVGVLNDYATNGQLVGNGGNSALTIDLTKNPGLTTAYIIPEPASLTLFGFALVALGVRRRRG